MVIKKTFGVEFVPESNIKKLIKLTKLAEDNGFDTVWITDHYNNRNVYSVLTALAMNTNKIMMGTGVTNPVLVSPAWTSAAILTINEISEGRAFLGIGAGDKATFAKLGFGFDKPLTKIKNAVADIQTLTRDGKLETGAKLGFKTFKHKCGVLLNNKQIKAAKKEPMTCEKCGQPVSKDSFIKGLPIYVGAQGPKMLQFAGSTADGVLINASHPKDFVFAMKMIKQGAEEAGRKMEDIDVAAYASFSADPDATAAKKAAAIVVAFITVGSPPNVLEGHGIKQEDVNKLNDALKKGDFGALAASVNEDMLEAFTVAGNAEACIERIKGLHKIGVTQVVVGSPIGPKKETAIPYIAENILSQFK